MEQGRGTVGEVARAFLRLGVTAFGGPAAHIALMNREFVDERAWISREEFLDAVSAANIIPGPNSTEVAMHIGHRRAGALGLIAAGVGFILPAALLVTAIAAWYVRGAQLPATARALAAVQPVVLVILVQALGTFATTALRTRTLSVIAVLSVLLAMAGVPELLVLAVGAVAALSAVMARRDTVRSAAIVGAGGLQALSLQGATTGATATIGLLPLFLSFLKIGSVLFGSGYVLLVFLRAEFVDRLHWITTGQLLDAVAVGQLTPGPLFTAATFIGYLVAGGRGATVATIGIFLPAFLLVALSARLLPIVRRHAGFSAALDGINAASLALMSTVAVHLGITALATPMQWGIGVVSAALVFRWRAPTWALVTGAALLGLLVA
jgi:chromate transporter